MATPREFARRIKMLADKIEVNADRETVSLANLVQQTVILSTPVDTGRARGNWFATLGFPRTFADENAQDKSGQRTIASNESAIQPRREGQAIFITNNLPYIQRLNDGYSAQAPAGFVEKAIAVARAKIKQVRLLK